MCATAFLAFTNAGPSSLTRQTVSMLQLPDSPIFSMSLKVLRLSAMRCDSAGACSRAANAGTPFGLKISMIWVSPSVLGDQNRPSSPGSRLTSAPVIIATTSAGRAEPAKRSSARSSRRLTSRPTRSAIASIERISTLATAPPTTGCQVNAGSRSCALSRDAWRPIPIWVAFRPGASFLRCRSSSRVVAISPKCNLATGVDLNAGPRQAGGAAAMVLLYSPAACAAVSAACAGRVAASAIVSANESRMVCMGMDFFLGRWDDTGTGVETEAGDKDSDTGAALRTGPTPQNVRPQVRRGPHDKPDATVHGSDAPHSPAADSAGRPGMTRTPGRAVRPRRCRCPRPAQHR